MSEVLAEIARRFVYCNLPANEFSDEFIQRWKQERDSGQLLHDSPFDSEIFSSIFCMADLYNPQPDREDYEFGEEKLRVEVKRLIDQNSKHDA